MEQQARIWLRDPKWIDTWLISTFRVSLWIASTACSNSQKIWCHSLNKWRNATYNHLMIIDRRWACVPTPSLAKHPATSVNIPTQALWRSRLQNLSPTIAACQEINRVPSINISITTIDSLLVLNRAIEVEVDSDNSYNKTLKVPTLRLTSAMLPVHLELRMILSASDRCILLPEVKCSKPRCKLWLKSRKLK